MKYEKPQKGNPHRLTVNQHVFPARSIERFADGDGKVSVRLLKLNKLLKLSPCDQLFCAKRVWGQRAEIGYMKKIEDEFQSLADRIVDGLRSLTPREHALVSKFCVLWHLRAQRRTQPEPDHPLKGVTGANFTKDHEETLEKAHVLFTRGNAVPGRMMLAIKLQMQIDALMSREFNGKQWGIMEARGGNFIIPDIPNMRAVPVLPDLLLVCDHGNTVIFSPDIASINTQIIGFAVEYLIAGDFRNCHL